MLLERLTRGAPLRGRTRGRRASPTAKPSRRRPRATTATRSRPAAPASSARCSCASSRCRAAPASSSSTRSRAARFPRKFIPAVEKGVRQALEAGVIAGYPVVDVRVIVYDGKHHSVDSKEIAFVHGRAARPSWRRCRRRGRSCWSRSSTWRSPRPNRTWATSPATCRHGAARSAARPTAPGGAGRAGAGAAVGAGGYQSRLNALTGGQGRYTLGLQPLRAGAAGGAAQLVSQYKVKDES